MFGQGYVGTAEDAAKLRRLEKQREEKRKAFEAQQQKTLEKGAAGALRQFGASATEVLEASFKSETIGLTTREEFMLKRATLAERSEEAAAEARRAEEAAAAAAREAKRKREKQKQKATLKLSFNDDEEAVGTSPVDGKAAADGPDGEEAGRKRAKRVGKDPTVDTTFLMDRDREAQEEELKAQLKKEYLAQQAAVRAEHIEVQYSYWDGQGHRRRITVRKGDTIQAFLKAVRDQLSPTFKELRMTSVDNLMFVKEDIILPHHCTFYDLIVNKVRGKSGPLFEFSIREDVRLVADATVEKADTHAGKVVERHWYDKNRHIFPASRWEVLDMDNLADQSRPYTVFQHGDKDKK